MCQGKFNLIKINKYAYDFFALEQITEAPNDNRFLIGKLFKQQLTYLEGIKCKAWSHIIK